MYYATFICFDFHNVFPLTSNVYVLKEFSLFGHVRTSARTYTNPSPQSQLHDGLLVNVTNKQNSMSLYEHCESSIVDFETSLSLALFRIKTAKEITLYPGW